MGPGEAKLAVGRKLDPDLLVFGNDVFDLTIFHSLELGSGSLCLLALGPGLFQCSGAKKAADGVGAKRRLGSCHCDVSSISAQCFVFAAPRRGTAAGPPRWPSGSGRSRASSAHSRPCTTGP